jgi:putative tryptophan/tyrosine transport system substrate-binding protein
VNRRSFITLLGGAAAWPHVARAQQPMMPVIGFLSSRSPGESAHLVEAFRRGLSESGFVEGRNMVIAFRWAEGRYDRLPALAAELVASRASVIVAAGGPPPTLAAKAATTSIPIVFTGMTDPVKLGVVDRVNRPGGNVTGMATFSSELGSKRLGLLHELVPTARVMGALVNPNFPQTDFELKDMRTAAQALGLQLEVKKVRSEGDFDPAFKTIAQSAGALIVGTDPFFETQRFRIVELAARHALVTIYSFREYAVAGGLISYGISIAENYRQAGVYAGRILKGEKPAELPVVQPTKFELVINLKTAKALGLEVPPMLLARADEVIE